MQTAYFFSLSLFIQFFRAFSPHHIAARPSCASFLCAGGRPKVAGLFHSQPPAHVDRSNNLWFIILS
jgi:hypothetical protein